MKSKFIFAIMAAAMLASCGTKTSDTKKDEVVEPEAKEAQAINIDDSKWRLQDFAGATEMVTTDSADFYLTFSPDGTFSMQTDCNQIGGEYKISGDSLTFQNTMASLMACPDQKVEDAMKAIFPMVSTYVITGDSVLSLRADARTMARFTYVKQQ